MSSGASDDSESGLAGLLIGQSSEFTLEEVSHCVLWQFPIDLGNGLVAAIKGLAGKSDWLPTIVYRSSDHLKVFGDLHETFASPEAAAGWLMRSEGQDKIEPSSG